MTPQEADLLLSRAIGATIGVLVRTNDPERAQKALGDAKRRDPAYAGLAFRRNPYALDGDEIFIVHGKASQDDERTEGGPIAEDI